MTLCLEQVFSSNLFNFSIEKCTCHDTTSIMKGCADIVLLFDRVLHTQGKTLALSHDKKIPWVKVLPQMQLSNAGMDQFSEKPLFVEKVLMESGGGGVKGP